MSKLEDMGAHRLPPRWGGVPGRSAAVFLLVGGLALLTSVTSRIDPETGDHRVATWAIVALLISSAAGTLWIWRAKDEAAREADKRAWYWGAAVGVAMAMPLLLAREGERLRNGLGLDDSFAHGALSLLMLQIVGYALVWGFGRLRGR